MMARVDFGDNTVYWGGRIRNTPNNYVAEAAGVLAQLQATPIQADLKMITDAKALYFMVAPVIEAHNKACTFVRPEGARIKMGARPLINAIDLVLNMRAQLMRRGVPVGQVSIVHQMSHTGDSSLEAEMLAGVDWRANVARGTTHVIQLNIYMQRSGCSLRCQPRMVNCTMY